MVAALAVLTGASESRAEDDSLDSYRIEATLDPAANRVDATAKIDWHNRSGVPIKTLFFHLYANAFAHPRTVFMLEQGERLRGAHLDRAGGIDLLSLSSADGKDLLAHSDSELVHEDRTQLHVDLDDAVAPHASLRLQLRFAVRLPSIVARMGASGRFFMIAQWFPKLARLEPDGTWASFPYHGLGEFYADFANYEITLHVPRDYVVAAPGERISHQVEAAGAITERYRLQRALDVAWSAFPDYRRVSASAGGVEIEVYAPPGHHSLQQREATLLADAVTRLSTRLGAYPYPRLVSILPPASAEGAAGMEYPGLIVGWTASWRSELNPIATIVHDVVSSHELAHQWFPMLVASHEVEAPVMDEGLAEWLGLDLLRSRYDRVFFRKLAGLDVDLFEIERANYASSRTQKSSLLPAYAYHPEQLAAAVYLRPCLTLESVRRSFGARRLDATLGRYARAYRFAHPRLEQLLAAFDAAYWPGFGERPLRETLAGQPFRRSAQPDPWRQDLVDRVLPFDVDAARRGPHPLLARLLLLAQMLFSVIGP
jgi:hypothetical protein